MGVRLNRDEEHGMKCSHGQSIYSPPPATHLGDIENHNNAARAVWVAATKHIIALLLLYFLSGQHQSLLQLLSELSGGWRSEVRSPLLGFGESGRARMGHHASGSP